MAGREDLVTVGVDGTSKDDRAVDWAAEEAARRGTGLHVLHAFWVIPMGVAGVALPVELAPHPALTERPVARARAAHPDLAVTGEIVLEEPGSALVEASRRSALLVVGARGLGRIAGRLLGSVSHRVVSHAECPVVVVRDLAQTPDGPVVVGVVPGDTPYEVLRFAFEHASRRGLPVRLVHAEEFRYPPVGTRELRAAFEEMAAWVATEQAAALEELAEEWRGRYPGLEVETVQSRRHPVEVLTDEGAEASLLVVGSRARSGMTGHRLGSVARGVLHGVPVTAVVRVTPDR
jgi:nucleotide-binding universal stress UspA family protein